jgi:cyclopropane fatty-acyl-phospholipid synthase-like methyltransferase
MQRKLNLPNDKPYSEACEQNREPILNVIKPLLAHCTTVFEIGSGTGQHAVYFTEQMPHLVWQTSDCPANHAGIRQWLTEAGRDNLLLPLSLCLPDNAPPDATYDAVFSANALHIMGDAAAAQLFPVAAKVLKKGGVLVVYGPFNYQGHYTSDSNALFDAYLKNRDPHSGIKNFETLNGWAEGVGLALVDDVEMPVNNRILVWRRD